MRGRIAALVAAIVVQPIWAEKPPEVRLITAEERRACEYLGPVTIGSAWAWHSSKGAMKGAYRKVAAMGGDSLFLAGQNNDFWTGAAVNGEAYRCLKKSP